MRKQNFIFITVAVAILAVGYFVGWHTGLGRFVRGISSVTVVNHSGRQLPFVSFYLFDGQGEQIVRQFGPLDSEHSVMVRVRTPSLAVRRIYCDEGTNVIAYEGGGKVIPGEDLLVVVDSQGIMRGQTQ